MPKHDEKKKCYTVLGLNGSADEDDVKRAFTKLALTYHPDLCLKKPDEVTKHRYHDICKAFKRLSTEDSNLTEWNNDKSDEIFFSLLREPLQNCSRAGVLYSLLSSSLDAHSTFQNDNLYRCKEDVIEDDDDEAQYIQMLISILENRLKTGKSVPAGLTHDKISKLHTEFNRLKEVEKKAAQEKLSIKKAKVQPVSVTKPKPKTKKQLMAEQRRRELEMSKIEQELEEKRKREEEKETTRKQLETERQKKLEEQQRKEEEERKRQQQEARRKREKEEKEKEAKLQKEKERQEKVRKQQEEEKKRKTEEKSARLKAIKEAKEKEEREKQELAKKSQQLKRQQQFQQYQQQQQKYPREVPPRFLKQQKGSQASTNDTSVSPSESQAKQIKSTLTSKPEAVHKTPSPNPQDADEEWGGGIPVNDNWNTIASDVDDTTWQQTVATPPVQQQAPPINNVKQPSVVASEEHQSHDLRTKSKQSLGNCSNAAVAGDSSSVGAIANNFGAIGDLSNRNSPLWGGPDSQRPDWTPRTSDSGASPLIVDVNDNNQDNKINFAHHGSWSKAPGQPLPNKCDKLKTTGNDKVNTNKWPALDVSKIEQSNVPPPDTGTKLKIPISRNSAQIESREGSPHDDVRRRESATGSGSYGRELVENSRLGVNLAGLDAKLDSNAKVTGWLATSPCMDEMETTWHDTDSLDADMDGPGWEWTTTTATGTSASSTVSKKVKTYAAAGAQGGNTEAAPSPSPSARENISAVADANLELLIDMGFPREAAEKALRHSNGVVETAVNELLGVNDEVNQPTQSQVENHQQQIEKQDPTPAAAAADQTTSSQPQKLNRKQRRKLQQQRQQQQQQTSADPTGTQQSASATTTSKVDVAEARLPTELESLSIRSLPSGPNPLEQHIQQPLSNRYSTGMNPAVASVEPHQKYPSNMNSNYMSASSVSNVDPILTSSYLGDKSISMIPGSTIPPQSLGVGSQGTNHLQQSYPITSRPVDPMASSFPPSDGMAQSKLFKWKQGNVVPDRREAPSVSVDPISAKWGVIAAPKLSPTPAEFKPGVPWKSKADLEKQPPQDRAGSTAIITPTVINKPMAGHPLHNAGNLLLHPTPIDHPSQIQLPQSDQQSAFQSLWKPQDLRRSDPVPWLVFRGAQSTVNADQLKTMCQHYGQLLNFFHTTINCYARFESSQHAKVAYSEIHPRLSLMVHQLTCELCSDTDVAAELQRIPKQPLINQPSSSSSLGSSSNNPMYDANGLSSYSSDRGNINTNLNDPLSQGLSSGPNGQTPWSNQQFPQQRQPPSNPWMNQDIPNSYGLLSNPSQGLPGTYDIWNSGQPQAKLQQQQQQQQTMHPNYSSDFLPHTDLGALYTSQGS